jgi:hypothetical protein
MRDIRDRTEEPQAADALTRVLGLEEPELSCEECFTKLNRYVELSLTSDRADSEVPGMGAHLDGCPACAEDFRSLRDLVAAEQEEEE